MKYSFLICLIIIGSCQPAEYQGKPDDDWLQMYAQQSPRTDPADHTFLLDPLPHSLDSLCRLIKCQLIHPLEARQMDLSLEELTGDGDVPTVRDVLEHLFELDNDGIHLGRDIPDRLVVACYHHAMLLASILRHQGVPVRMRAGFSKIYEKEYGIRFGHVICEVWDHQSEKWILVDPDREIVNLPYRDFDFACEAWRNVKDNRTEDAIYTSSVSDGVKGIINLMILDAALIIKDEKLYWDLPELIVGANEINHIDELDDLTIQTLIDLAECCESPDIHINDIAEIYQQTESFKPSGLDYDSYFKLIMSRE